MDSNALAILMKIKAEKEKDAEQERLLERLKRWAHEYVQLKRNFRYSVYRRGCRFILFFVTFVCSVGLPFVFLFAQHRTYTKILDPSSTVNLTFTDCNYLHMGHNQK